MINVFKAGNLYWLSWAKAGRYTLKLAPSPGEPVAVI
jgi:hypothetical protein